MLQEPIPSSLSSSSGKKVIDAKNDSKKGATSSSGKGGSKLPSERTPERQFRRSPPESHDISGKLPLRRPVEPSFRSKEPQARQGNYGAGSGRQVSPMRRGGLSPVVKRAPSAGRRGYYSPVRRPPSPGRRVGRGGPSPKRFRSPPRTFSPPRRRTPLRRSPPRRLSPPRRDSDFGPSSHRLGEKGYSKGVGTQNRGYSPPRRAEPHSSNFSSRGHDQTYGPSSSSNPPWQPPYEGRSLNSGAHPSGYGPARNQFSDSRQQERRSWDNRSDNQTFNHSRPAHGTSVSAQWNHPVPNNFSTLPPNINVPPPSFESRSGGFNNGPPSGRFNDRRLDDPKFSPPREEPKRPWNDNRSSNAGTPSNSGRFDEGRGFSDRGNDHRMRPDDKYDKYYHRSPPRDYQRDKRPTSPARDYPRDFDSGHGRREAPWDCRKRSPEPSFGDFGRGTGRRRSRSPDLRRSPPKNRQGDYERGGRRRSRSPLDFRPIDRPSRIDSRRSPPGSRSRDSPHASFEPPHFEVSRAGVEPSYPDKRYYASRDDCRDLLNQKRHVDGGDRDGDFYSDSKAPNKLDVRGIPKEVDLRKVIRGAIAEPPLKERLGPPPRDDAVDSLRRGRSRSPRPRSPPWYGAPSRRY